MLFGMGVIILHKMDRPANGSVKLLLIETFKEKAARIGKNFGLNDQNLWNGGRYDLH